MNKAEEIKEMDKCITALRYELPASIIDDVESRWNKVKEAIAAQQTPAAENVKELAKDTLQAFSYWKDKEFKDGPEGHKVVNMRPILLAKQLCNEILKPAQQTPADLPDEEEVPDNMSFEWYIHATLVKFHPDLSFEKREELVRGMQAHLSTPTGEGEAVAWIPVSERQPEIFQTVAFVVESSNEHYNGQVMGGKYQGFKHGRYHAFTTPGIEWGASHWMPLPEPPKQQP